MTGSRRFLIFFMALGLLSILGASLYQRFAHPSLTVSRAVGVDQDAPVSAIGQLMEKVAKKPTDRDLLLELVEQLMAIGQWQSAENFAQRALNLDAPDNLHPRAMYLLAVIHHNMGRHKEAAELLEKMLAKEENPSARYSLGILYLHFLHEPEAGIRQLEKGLAAPDLPQSLADAMREEIEKARARFPAPVKPETGEPDQPKSEEQ